MGGVRKPFQGILNIIRFNWHFYVIALGAIMVAFILSLFSSIGILQVLQLLSVLLFLSILISLFVSWYIYDLSGFYEFSWVQNDDSEISVVNIHAGFDETSETLKDKFKNANFLMLDFYDPLRHTEVSIKRARKQFSPKPNTLSVSTEKINLVSHSVDKIFLILSAHEIRSKEERIIFFTELNRIIKSTGQIAVTEHLRDIANFGAYNIGSWHFFSKSSWLRTFESSGLNVVSEIKNTPFISTFILEQNGDAI